MKNKLIYTFKKLNNFKYLFNKSIEISLNSLISPISYKGLKGTNDHKIIVNNSVLSGSLLIKEGCKINNVHCSGNIELDRFVSLNGPGTRLSSRIEGIKIGAFTSIASNVVIQEDNHRINQVSTYFMSQNIFGESINNDIDTKGAILIEEDVWIGSNSVVLSGVTIGRGSIIGAGSIVTKDIPRYSIVVGNPARVIKSRFSDKVINQLEESQWWTYNTKEMIEMKDIFSKNIDKDLRIFGE